MRKKVVKHFSLKRLFVLGAISFALPAFTAVPVSAAETASTVTLEDIEQKRKNMEDAQKEYDMALADRHAAEDLVENSRRARDDAQEQYDIIMEKYKKGFAGFLQWVIDTEDDPLKVEDARSTLTLLKESGETDDISPLSPRNITRMYSTAQWLDEYADFLEQYEDRGVTGATSHYTMNYAQIYSYSPDPHILDNMPLNIDNCWLGTFAEDRDGVPVWDHSQDKHNTSVLSVDTTNSLYITFDGSYGSFRSDITLSVNVGLSSFVYPDSGENMSFDYVLCGLNLPYTLREYAQALRDYYALVDPLPYKAAVDGFDDDLTNAKRELISAEDLVTSKFSRLKDAQKDYDEAVARYSANTALPEQTAADPVILPAYEIAYEEPVYTEEEFTEASAMAMDNTSLSETASDATAFTYTNTTSKEENTKKPAEEQNGILMRVLSYIFNGGAIAVIIPAGFRRRKKDQFIGVIL